jgi:hypothetical protein
MGKRGESQIDWIISLSLFLIYIAWFFIFIRPNISLGTSKDTLITILKTNFDADSSWELKEYPLFVEYNSSGGRKPLMLDYTQNRTDIYFTDGTPFVIWNSKLFFVANVSQGMNAWWLIEGVNQSNDFYYEGLNTENDRAATENLSVYFEDSMPQNVLYKGTVLIGDISYEINGESFSPVSHNYTNRGMVAFFTAAGTNINHTTVIFPYIPETENFIDLGQDEGYNMVIDADLYQFRSYYSDNGNYGNFQYSNSSQNLNYTYNYITLTGSSGSISMFFDSDVKFNFTYYNTTLRVKMVLPIEGDYNYRLQFHDGNYSSAVKKSYSSSFGAVKKLRGVNLNNISTNYSRLKARWGFPADRNFQILVYENSSAFLYADSDILQQIGKYDESSKSVYTESQDIKALDETGNYRTISLLYKIW